MSKIFFVFSDESGNYKQNPGRKFLKSNPYYIRSAFIIEALEWKSLRKKFLDLKWQYYLNKHDEIKWSDIWSEYKKYKNGMVQEEEYLNKIEFIKRSLKFLNKLSYCKIIFTITDNNKIHTKKEIEIKKWHIQNMMQRIQMEVQKQNDNLAIVFIDPLSNKETKLFQDIYKEIFLNDRFIDDYKNLKDTLNFEPSHHSVGIQLADYLAGCFNGFMKNFPTSTEIFKNIVYPMVRKDLNNDYLGRGIIGIPNNKEVREKLREKLDGIIYSSK
ncbi:DUF3800 domain-containing protein [Methanothermococcus sp. SCGC AD-155-C09]|nr:DUF3800 domain-containing protein [Methanothermococcus sp. SCGC AD-155-C09]